MRNQSKEVLRLQELAEKQKKRRGLKKAMLFRGDDLREQVLHQSPIRAYSEEHYECRVSSLPFVLCEMNVGIPRFYAVMYAVFVSLDKIYGDGTVTRWSDYLSSFLPEMMFPKNKRRKLQEVLSNTWCLTRNYIQDGYVSTRYSPSYNKEIEKFREHFVEMRKFFR